MIKLDVTIMGQPYKLACQEGQDATLHEAVAYLNEKMCAIRDAGKIKGNVLRFSFKQADGLKGTGKFTLADDGGSFDGSYAFGSGDEKTQGTWAGQRQ